MKKIILSAFVSAMVLIACSPKATPTSSTGATGMPATATTKAAAIAAGATIFTTTCTKCHGAKTEYVQTHTYQEAIPVMNSMSKKAKLTQEQVEQLAAYVNSVAKK